MEGRDFLHGAYTVLIFGKRLFWRLSAETFESLDTVRLWRSDFMRGGVEALEATVAPGPPPLKSEAALRVVAPLLEAPVADRQNLTIPRLITEIETR